MTGKLVCFKNKRKVRQLRPRKDTSTARQVKKITKSVPDFEKNAADFVRL